MTQSYDSQQPLGRLRHDPTLHSGTAPLCPPLLGSSPAPQPHGGCPRAIPLSPRMLRLPHPWGQPHTSHSLPKGGGTAASQRWAHGAEKGRCCHGAVPNVQELVAMPCQHCHPPLGIFQHHGPPRLQHPAKGVVAESGAGRTPWLEAMRGAGRSVTRGEHGTAPGTAQHGSPVTARHHGTAHAGHGPTARPPVSTAPARRAHDPR